MNIDSGYRRRLFVSDRSSSIFWLSLNWAIRNCIFTNTFRVCKKITWKSIHAIYINKLCKSTSLSIEFCGQFIIDPKWKTSLWVTSRNRNRQTMESNSEQREKVEMTCISNPPYPISPSKPNENVEKGGEKTDQTERVKKARKERETSRN